MTNNKQKGKRGERYFADELKDIFPNIKRNLFAQARDGGVDLINSSCFNFEVKIGKQGCIKKTRNWLNQIKEEGRKTNWDVVLVKPDREKGYIIMPFADFKEMLWMLRREELI